jgi:superfamily II DNA or RNA helicase
VKSAEETAHRFSAAGYKFENIDGRMSHAKRRTLIDAVATGRIHGITSCDLVTYGLDVPGLECIIKLRPTLSKALDSQMNGRGLRAAPGKRDCVILDHVGAIAMHGHPLDAYQWRFNGVEKHGREPGKAPAVLHLCERCFLYYTESKCPNCGSAKTPQQREDLKIVDGRLVEVKAAPVSLHDLSTDDMRIFNLEVADAIEKNSVADVLLLAEIVHPGNKSAQETWTYRKLNTLSHAVNKSLLHEIAKIRGYKPGWVYFRSMEFRKQQPQKQARI